jgi:phosphoglycerate kinase
MITKVDRLVIGGAMANTFLAAEGREMGRSLSEPDMFATAREIVAKAADGGCQLVLPTDGVAAAELKEGAEAEIVAVQNFPADAMMLDLGPASVASIVAVLKDCRSLVWNGPLGAFEFPPFDGATNAVARAAADLTKGGQLLSVAGGGDTVAALENAGVIDRFSYVSTAGGAFLEWLEGRELPGIAVLKERADAR